MCKSIAAMSFLPGGTAIIEKRARECAAFCRMRASQLRAERRIGTVRGNRLDQEQPMSLKILLTAATVLTIGIGAAHAQNQPTTNVSPPPNSINKGNLTKPSGAEAQAAAQSRGARIIGSGKFCTEAGPRKSMQCRYSSMAACEKSAPHGNLHCVARPS
jgi:hypothetical protein